MTTQTQEPALKRSIGRKVLLLFVIGSAGCALAGSAWAMIGWRVVQAVGACAGVVLARAMVRDLYEGDRAARMLSTLMTVMAVAPLLGPIVGGQILALAGWRAIFWTLVGIGLATLATVLGGGLAGVYAVGYLSVGRASLAWPLLGTLAVLVAVNLALRAGRTAARRRG